MTSPSPSDFLTFSRRLTMQLSVRSTLTRRPMLSSRLAMARPFSLSTTRYALGKPSTDDKVNTSEMPDDKHTLNKSDRLDVQGKESSKGREAAAKGEGGTATQGDTRNSSKKAKEEFPEAPTTIGMQDERGGKGL